MKAGTAALPPGAENAGTFAHARRPHNHTAVTITRLRPTDRTSPCNPEPKTHVVRFLLNSTFKAFDNLRVQLASTKVVRLCSCDEDGVKSARSASSRTK